MADLVRNFIFVSGTPERVAEAKAILEECEGRNTEFSVMGLVIEVTDDGSEFEARFSSKWQSEDGPMWEIEQRLADAIEAGDLDVSC